MFPELSQPDHSCDRLDITVLLPVPATVNHTNIFYFQIVDQITQILVSFSSIHFTFKNI